MLVGLEDATDYAHVVLAPHPDDAALSCGGMIAARDRVLVVTVCTATPPPDVEQYPLVAWLHRAQGMPGAELWQRRREEDVRAADSLGADVVHVGLLDAPYRLPAAYRSAATLFGTPAADDDLARQIAGVLAQLAARVPSATLYAPLAVGSHVDHRAAFEAAQRARFATTLYYEDFPYVATQPASLDERLATAHFEPVAIDIRATLDRKLQAIAAYETQTAMLFGTRDRMRAMVEARPSERFWRQGLS